MHKSFLIKMMMIIGLLSCSPKIHFHSAEVNFLYKETQGTITVKSTGYGKIQSEAVTDAQKNAFEVILFKGLPDTELNLPLIENESEARSKHTEYFNKFFDDGYYKTFIMSSTESSNLMKRKKGSKITVEIKINYNSLRKDLEANHLIRKFGF